MKKRLFLLTLAISVIATIGSATTFGVSAQYQYQYSDCFAHSKCGDWDQSFDAPSSDTPITITNTSPTKITNTSWD